MMEFIMCIVEYLIKALFYVAVAGLGAFIGIKMRKSSDAKKEAAATTEEQSRNSSVMKNDTDTHACMKVSVMFFMR